MKADTPRTTVDGNSFTVSFSTIVPGFDDFEVVVGESAGKRSLTMRDAQHEYVFTEQ
jgi:hypothetical protein